MTSSSDEQTAGRAELDHLQKRFHVDELSLRIKLCSAEVCSTPHFTPRSAAEARVQELTLARLTAGFSVDPQTHDRKLVWLRDAMVPIVSELKLLSLDLTAVYRNELATETEADETLEELSDLMATPGLDATAKMKGKKAEKLLNELKVLKREEKELEAAYGGWTRYYSGAGPSLHAGKECYRVWAHGSYNQFKGRLEPAYSGQPLQAIMADPRDLCAACFPLNRVPAKPATGPECVGSRTTNFSPTRSRTGYTYGHLGTCGDCGQRVTVTKTGKLRLHRLQD